MKQRSNGLKTCSRGLILNAQTAYLNLTKHSNDRVHNSHEALTLIHPPFLESGRKPIPPLACGTDPGFLHEHAHKPH